MGRNKLWTPDLVFPKVPLASVPKKGMELVNLRQLGILPSIAGAAEAPTTTGTSHGYHAAGDVVTQTADGVPLDSIWRDFMDLLNAVNGSRQALIRFLTFGVTSPIERVAQLGAGVDFEEATEFGEPTGSRVSPTYFNMAYSFKWYDLAARYTWQYLADATAEMVNSVANAAVEAYYRLQLFQVLKTVFNSTNLTASINQNAYTVYKFYNADGTVPPTYKTNTFTGSHTHYRTTGAATLNAGDFDEIITDFNTHGYGMENGYRQVVLVHSSQVPTIRTFKSVANGGTGTYDFIPAQGSPGTILTVNQQVFGAGQVSNTLDGLTVVGSYGPLYVVQEDWLPTDYIFAFCTGGSLSIGNPIGIREHQNQGLRGMRLVKGKQADYPLIDSFWNTGFGTGVRQRAAGMVMQITTNGSYTIPTTYA